MEIFDVVDEHDQVIGQAPRQEVHAKKWHHRAIHVFVFNAKGEIFLQFRSRKKNNHPLTWDSSCSGHVDTGETYREAAVRELGEEIGIQAAEARALQEVMKIGTCPETGFEHCWLYTLRHNGPFVLHPEEIEDGRWFETEEIDRTIEKTPEKMAPPFIYIWDKWRQGAGA
ncbi:MAG: NUDIX domain-containing protein [Verrucomicrobiae bacterium]|nr:NUDIX domain-containing protein [Verrucomicrobiae bacterium]